tara:strand:- start:207 stop:590 length:384 start_codon:yes stop_codon:yes gene_type:complete
MKKVTLSVAALALAMSSYGQCVLDYSDSVLVSQESIQAGKSHENLRDIVYKAEDMLSMIKQDVDSGYIYEQYAKFYQKLLKDIIKLTVTIDDTTSLFILEGHYSLNEDDQAYYYDNYSPCENCDEID